MNEPFCPAHTETQISPVRRGRPKKNTVALHVRVRPETARFLRYKARRKQTLGTVIDRAVRSLEIELLLS